MADAGPLCVSGARSARTGPGRPTRRLPSSLPRFAPPLLGPGAAGPDRLPRGRFAALPGCGRVVV